MRVTVQLVRVRDGIPLWAAKFDENFTDIFGVEDSISEQVARALRPDLPVLIISGYAETDGMPSDLPRLTKPFREADLIAVLRQMTDGA